MTLNRVLLACLLLGLAGWWFSARPGRGDALPAAVHAVPGLTTPAGGVTEAVLVTVVCADSGPAAISNIADASQSTSRRPIFDTLLLDV